MEQPHGDDERTAQRRDRDPMKHYRMLIETVLSEEDPDWSKLYPYIIQPDLDPNRVAKDTKISTLHRCAYDGDARVLKWCLARDAELDAKTSLGRTALHYACDANRPECVKILLEAKADPMAMTLSGSTPIHLCCSSKGLEALMELLKADTMLTLDVEDSRRRTPDMLTSDPDILEELQVYKASMDSRRHALLVKEAVMALVGKSDTGLSGYVFALWVQLVKEKGESATAAPNEGSQGTTVGEREGPVEAGYVPAYALAMQG